MDFFDCELDVTEITLVCEVPAGAGEAVHNKRPSHGLALNLSGEKTYIFDGAVSLTVRANDIIFLPENSNYTVRDDSPGACYAINFKLREQVLPKPFVFRSKSGASLTDRFAAAEKEFRRKGAGYMLKCKSELYCILYQITREHSQSYAPVSKKRLLEPAISYIHNYYSKGDIGIGFLSELCGFKESYFRRTFALCYGTSPVRYINRLKLARAKELLAENEYSVATVAELSGFGNVYYFCRFFKKETGATPTEYAESRQRD